MWATLPDLLLEDIFSMLSHRQRYYCSLVCWNWYQSFDSPRVWRRLVVGERTFTQRRFNLYKGYQHEISHYRVQMCLGRIGHHVRHLEILPITNYFNLYEFLNVLSCYLEFFDEYPMVHLEEFNFTFACENRSLSDSLVIGTGGKMLVQLKRLLGNLQNIKTLRLNQLHLESEDVAGLLANIPEECRTSTITCLEILNSTKKEYPVMEVASFTGLKKLIFSPMQLTSAMLLKLAEKTVLSELFIVQDSYGNISPAVDSSVWWQVKELLPHLRVHLRVQGSAMLTLLIQSNAPVWSVVYNSPRAKVDLASIVSITDEYRVSLRTFAYLGLPREHGSRAFQFRGDNGLLLLMAECINIKTLAINERISTQTLLLIASRAKSLKHLYVRRNGVLLRRDWPASVNCPDELYVASRSYLQTEQAVARMIGDPAWTMLSDNQFKKIDLI